VRLITRRSLVQIQPRNHFIILFHKGLLDSSRPFSFLGGCKWVQNSAQLTRDPVVVFTRDVSIHAERKSRIAVSESLLPDLQWAPS
jgi:hypothetical protein